MNRHHNENLVTDKNIEVVYATPFFLCRKNVIYKKNMTVEMAIEASQILYDVAQSETTGNKNTDTSAEHEKQISHEELLDLAKTPVGVFGERVRLGHILSAGDRVEIYRELLIDPKEARRKRAQL